MEILRQELSTYYSEIIKKNISSFPGSQCHIKEVKKYPEEKNFDKPNLLAVKELLMPLLERLKEQSQEPWEKTRVPPHRRFPCAAVVFS